MLLCNAPVAHWVWGGGFLGGGDIFGEDGVLDFAGGIVGARDRGSCGTLVVAAATGRTRRDKSTGRRTIRAMS